MIGTSSIDTTCTIWDVNTQTARTQLIAHDREVFDLAFSRGTDLFASVGADGSVRLFDLRSLEHSTIIYETPNLDPLLRLEWNKQDPNYLATFKVDSRSTIILDIRVPSTPVTELGGHSGSVNAVAWAPHSSCHICTAGDDSQALIWDLSNMSKRPVEDPILAYNAEGEVNNLQWSASQPDWVGIAFSDKLQICECFFQRFVFVSLKTSTYDCIIIFFFHTCSTFSEGVICNQLFCESVELKTCIYVYKLMMIFGKNGVTKMCGNLFFTTLKGKERYCWIDLLFYYSLGKAIIFVVQSLLLFNSI